MSTALIVVVLVLIGTVLATNALDPRNAALDVRGLVFGLLSALSFTGTLISTGRIAPHLPSVRRSQLMLYGGALVVLVFALLMAALAATMSMRSRALRLPEPTTAVQHHGTGRGSHTSGH